MLLPVFLRFPTKQSRPSPSQVFLSNHRPPCETFELLGPTINVLICSPLSDVWPLLRIPNQGFQEEGIADEGPLGSGKEGTAK